MGLSTIRDERTYVNTCNVMVLSHGNVNVCWSCTVHNTFVGPVSAHHSTSASARTAPHPPHPSPDQTNLILPESAGSQSVDCGLSFQGQMRPAALLFCHLEMGFIIERAVLHIYWAIVFVLISPDSHYMCSGLQVFGPCLQG